MKVKVTDLDTKNVGEIDLSEEIFGADVRTDLMHRYVRWQLAKRRAGTHKTKTRSEVRSSTRKMYKQKGTGRARHGAAQVVQFRGGGTTFGPVVRDHGHKLPKKVRRFALRSALSSKQADGKLIVVESLSLADAKTKMLTARLDKLGWGSTLVIGGSVIDENFAMAAHNVPEIVVVPQQGANVYDILRRDTLVLTRDAVEQLEARLK